MFSACGGSQKCLKIFDDHLGQRGRLNRPTNNTANGPYNYLFYTVYSFFEILFLRVYISQRLIVCLKFFSPMGRTTKMKKATKSTRSPAHIRHFIIISYAYTMAQEYFSKIWKHRLTFKIEQKNWIRVDQPSLSEENGCILSFHTLRLKFRDTSPIKITIKSVSRNRICSPHCCPEMGIGST